MSAKNPSNAQYHEYISNHYGVCSRGADWCARFGCNSPAKPWLGRKCQYWNPVSWLNWKDAYKKVKEADEL